jgi:hypothetical protein
MDIIAQEWNKGFVREREREREREAMKMKKLDLFFLN